MTTKTNPGGFFRLTAQSSNQKTGPMPVSTSSANTCPDACPFKSGGCYAKSGPLAVVWRQVDAGQHSTTWGGFLEKIASLPAGTTWRHNQAGDLPGDNNQIDAAALAELVEANRGRRGFTYTHKPPTLENLAAIRAANAGGFTVNLSGNNLGHADELAAAEAGPVVVVVAGDLPGHKTTTPAGRRVVQCPATYRAGVTCASCQLCQKQRGAIVAFPAHGTSKKKAAAIASTPPATEPGWDVDWDA